MVSEDRQPQPDWWLGEDGHWHPPLQNFGPFAVMFYLGPRRAGSWWIAAFRAVVVISVAVLAIYREDLGTPGYLALAGLILGSIGLFLASERARRIAREPVRLGGATRPRAR